MWAPFSKRLAKLLGYSGKKTLCAECYQSRRRVCRLLKGVLGLRHLELEARKHEHA